MIITISREYGSGGGEIAHALAEKLGIPCYDKTVAQLTASLSGFSRESVEEAEDRVTGMFSYMNAGYAVGTLPLYDQIYLKQREAILHLAAQGDCVLVGRCAAHILEEAGMPALNVFIYAPMSERMARIQKKENVSEREAERRIRRKDAFRKNYYRRYAYAEWGNRQNYQLLVNSAVGVEKAVGLISRLTV